MENTENFIDSNYWQVVDISEDTVPIYKGNNFLI